MNHARKLTALALTATIALPLQAQQRIDPSRMIPVQGEVKHAGVVDVTTGRWTRPRAAGSRQKAGGVQVIYRNNCTWQTQGYFGGFEACEDNYDEGRVPSSNASGVPGTVGAEAMNSMQSFEIAYCTIAGDVSGAGGYDLDVAFWNNLGGDCVGNIAPTPPPPSVSATAYFALAGLGLPGSTSPGFQACWIVGFDVSNTAWTLLGDGDGVFDNDLALDKFTWMQRQNTRNSPLGYPSATPDGFLIVGEPLSGGFGACSYNIACGTDILFGNSCGTGLDTFDASWVNVDGIAAGDTSGATPPGCPNAYSQYGFGTNCYFFGGYPSNPLASYWLTLESERTSGPACGQVNSCGNNRPLIQSTTNAGTYAPNAGEYWSVVLTGVPAAPNPGILIYGTGGILANPITTGFGSLCVSPFFRATSTITTPQSLAGGCSTPSSYLWDMGVFADASVGSNGILNGNVITIQAWYRDPANPGTANFSQVVTGTTIGLGAPPPTISGFSPSSGGEATALSVTGANFGSTPGNVRVLMSSGRGVAGVNTSAGGALTATVFAVGQPGTGGTGMGPITVVRGAGAALPNNVIVIGPTTSTSSQTRRIMSGVGTNSVMSFNLTPASNNTVNDVSGAPLPGGLSLDMTGVTGNTLDVRLTLETNAGEFRVFEMRVDFTGVPPNDNVRAQALAQQLNANFGPFGVEASASSAMVRVSLVGSSYGSIVVKGV